MSEAPKAYLEKTSETGGSQIERLLVSIQAGESFPSEKSLQALTPDRLSEFKKAIKEAKDNLAKSIMALKQTSLDKN